MSQATACRTLDELELSHIEKMFAYAGASDLDRASADGPSMTDPSASIPT